MNSIRRIILIPGLLEPSLALWPLKRVLKKHCDNVECFRDRIVFRNIDESIARLTRMLEEEPDPRSIAIVTHSFGDWIARQAISRTSRPSVAALVSVAPVMRSGLVPAGIYLVSGNLIPEIKIIMDREKAAEQIDCDEQVRRLVIWAKVDECLRRVPLCEVDNLREERFAATHLSVILQPNVLHRIASYLFTPQGQEARLSAADRPDSDPHDP